MQKYHTAYRGMLSISLYAVWYFLILLISYLLLLTYK